MGMHRWSILLACMALASCASLNDTAVFYTPVSQDAYPPLPKDALVPLLAKPPAWPHRVIGRFDMQTDRGAKFAQKALLFNARRQGADAVMMRDINYDLRRTYNYIPPSWDYVPVTNYWNQRVKNNKGQCVNAPQYYTTFIPIFRPGGVVVNDVLWTRIRADMIVHRNKPRLVVSSEPPR